MNWPPSRMFEAGLKRLADNHAGLWFSTRRRYLNQLDEKSLLLLWWEGLWAEELATDFQKHRTTNAEITWINKSWELKKFISHSVDINEKKL